MWGTVVRNPSAILPLSEAPFTLKMIRDAIPPHCFERSTGRSMIFFVRDILLMTSLCWVTLMIQERVESSWLRVVVWNVYGLAQGAVAFGLWIIGHECGHRAFSESAEINDIVGLFAHSVLLTPYHSWRFTHASHHGSTAHIDKDTAFAPDSKKIGRGLTLMSPKAGFAVRSSHFEFVFSLHDDADWILDVFGHQCWRTAKGTIQQSLLPIFS